MYFCLALYQGLARMFVTVGMCEQAVAAYIKVSLLPTIRQIPHNELGTAYCRPTNACAKAILLLYTRGSQVRALLKVEVVMLPCYPFSACMQSSGVLAVASQLASYPGPSLPHNAPGYEVSLVGDSDHRSQFRVYTSLAYYTCMHACTWPGYKSRRRWSLASWQPLVLSIYMYYYQPTLPGG